jgi:hypothetical protein
LRGQCKVLEPLWGSRELLRFVLAVAAASGAATFLTLVLCAR